MGERKENENGVMGIEPPPPMWKLLIIELDPRELYFKWKSSKSYKYYKDFKLKVYKIYENFSVIPYKLLKVHESITGNEFVQVPIEYTKKILY